MELPVLNLPSFSFRIKQENDKTKIFDSIRRKWLVLSPEEWVRQNMTAFLIHYKNVPNLRIVNEVSLVCNGLQRRCDGLIYDDKCQPLIIMEYKAPHIQVNQKVFDQIAGYNYKLKVPYLLVSNGKQHLFCEVNSQTQSYRFFQEIPDYSTLIVG